MRGVARRAREPLRRCRTTPEAGDNGGGGRRRSPRRHYQRGAERERRSDRGDHDPSARAPLKDVRHHVAPRTSLTEDRERLGPRQIVSGCRRISRRRIAVQGIRSPQIGWVHEVGPLHVHSAAVRKSPASVVASCLVVFGLVAPVHAEAVVRNPGDPAYDVSLRADATGRTWIGTEQITFTNLDPSPLPLIWLRLWSNGVLGCGANSIVVTGMSGGTE